MRAVQYWLFAQGFNLVLLQKQAVYQNISKYLKKFNLILLQKQADHQEIQNYSILSSLKNKMITKILPKARRARDLVAFVSKVT